MSRTWIKLYTEILGDVKVGTLTDRQYRLMITCFLMAGQKDAKGRVGTTDEIAWALSRTTNGTTAADLMVLSKRGIISKASSGWHLVNWEKRQQKPPSREAAAEAARKRNVRRMSGACPEDVRNLSVGKSSISQTADKTVCPSPEAEAEVEAETEAETEAKAEEKELRASSAPKTRVRSPAQKANDLIHEAIAEVTKSPPGSFNGKVVADLRKELPDKAPEYIAAEIHRRFGVGGLWYQNDWRGRKGEAPKPQQIYPEWDRVLGGAQMSVSKQNETIIDQLIAKGREKRNAR